MLRILFVFLLLILNLEIREGNSSLTSLSNFNAALQAKLNEIEWVDNTLNSMSVKERIGQLMMIDVFPKRNNFDEDAIAKIIEEYHIGGVIFFKGDPLNQVRLTNKFQSKSKKLPLFVAIDGEWGLSMRLKETVKYPHQLMLGALQTEEPIYQMGAQIAEQLKRIGVHINFAPVVDVNNNPNNPVINDRSFGEDKYNVTKKGIAYMRGLQDNGIMACAKHFPGHGDTDVDSHYDLPVINHSEERIQDLELHPFREMVNAGLQSTMVAHLSIPSLDATANQASTLSYNIVSNILKDQLNFKGLIFTDALNMQGVAKYYQKGELELKALLAGNDVLLYPQDVKAAIDYISNALTLGQITQQRIDESVRKILTAKYKAGLTKFTRISQEKLLPDLHKISYELLNRNIAEQAITLVKNDKGLIPFKNLEKHKFASINIGGKANNIFQKSLKFYAPVDHYYLSKSANETDLQNILNTLKPYSTVFITLHDLSKYAKRNYGITPSMIDAINRINAEKEVVLIVHGSPYALSKLPKLNTVMVSYEDNELNQQIASQILFGAIAARGKMPVTASEDYTYGMGVNTAGGLRLKYTIPEEVGINRFDLLQIDSIALEAIDNKATPGCMVLMAKDGKVIFYKSYGHHTYAREEKVHPSDIYDLASLTKVCASGLSLMKLQSDKKIDIDNALGKYSYRVKGSNKEDLKIRDVLVHEAGLVSWIPFYAKTVNEKGKLDKKIYADKRSEKFSIKVADDIFLNEEYHQTMWDTILSSELLNAGRYRYSDLGFYILKDIVEQVTFQPFERFTHEKFYRPLGLSTMTFNPLNKHNKDWIVPTEKDDYFRNQTLHGQVHDMGAAMFGGVGGHAGLFSNANDIAIIFQMLLNKGSYGGKTYLNSEVVNDFTSIQRDNNRRGLSFDKPNMEDLDKSPCCEAATEGVFGHTGFTGTCAWADPKYNTIYVFLSNRVHPKMTNKKLIDEDYRPRIQQVLYDALENSGLTHN